LGEQTKGSPVERIGQRATRTESLHPKAPKTSKTSKDRGPGGTVRSDFDDFPIGR
jgi:hypothetical protein